MAVPVLTPASTLSAIVLPSSGNPADVSIALPLGIYSSNTDFLSGAADQVAFVYKRLGGDVLDIELTTGNVYAAYEEAVLEYSYIVNLHQSINALPTMLGASTGSFNQDGEFKAGSALVGQNPELAYPKYNLHYATRYGDAFSNEAGIGGVEPIYSASIPIIPEVQDYDLQAIIESASLNNYEPATGGPVPYSGSVGNRRVIIRRVFYKTPNSMWRFFGYYGGLNAIGNLSSYGQYADDSTFEVIPTWHNKLQAMAYETAIYTRNSHYSYEIKNNKIRFFPNPPDIGINNYWVEFSIQSESNPWETTSGSADDTVGGVNNMNTLPFANIPYNSINSIGKQWIRRYALAICKEMLGHVRSKFSTIPIPGESVTLNGSALMSEAKEEKKELKEELNKILDQITYHKLAEIEGKMSDDMQKLNQKIPVLIYAG
jgi:hypothetical protein